MEAREPRRTRLWGRSISRARGAVALALLVFACGTGENEPPSSPLSGGDTTVFDETREAFSRPARNLHGERRDAFFVGNAIFNRGWVTAPASVADFDGLGPVFNATNCSACHFKDGRGRPPLAEGEAFLSMLVRLSVPGQDEHGGPRPEPTYGGQLQGSAILGLSAEAKARVTYEEIEGRYGDGEVYRLRRPTYHFDDLANGPLASDVMLSPRTAPAMIGLGLLEAIADVTLLDLADPDDRDGNGISGRANRVYDVTSGTLALGRFGWKANQPSLLQQAAGAFNGDMGITSRLFPEESCTRAQTQCQEAPTGGEPELAEGLLADVVHYSRMLAVPARRQVDDPTVRRGENLFLRAGCDGCHTPTLHTADRPTDPELSNQTIHPFTDLLLHDMGEELGDGRPDFEATGHEWRTPPLWGIGLVGHVNQHELFLHDGRARGFAEAILWHGGEGSRARDVFRAMPSNDREALLAFLRSL